MPAFVTPMGQGAFPIAISMYRSFAADKQKIYYNMILQVK
jgi:hypothetical protein